MSIKPVAQKAQAVFVIIVDGERMYFDSQQEADDFQRNPMVQAALTELTESTGATADLADFLFENKDAIADCFGAGKARKLSRKERGELERALKALVALANPDLAFLATHAETVKSSFKFEAKRMSDDDRKLLVKGAIVTLVNNTNVSDWINTNIEALKEAFNAGIEKRVISDGLVEYRERMAAEKEAKRLAAA
jgi:hypothetical protein